MINILTKGEIQTTINLYHSRIAKLKREVRDNKGKSEVRPYEFELTELRKVRSKLFDWMKIIEGGETT